MTKDQKKALLAVVKAAKDIEPKTQAIDDAATKDHRHDRQVLELDYSSAVLSMRLAAAESAISELKKEVDSGIER